MYSAKVMDHFEHPRNVGEIEDASGVGTVGNAKCGDIMRIYCTDGCHYRNFTVELPNTNIFGRSSRNRR